MSADENTPEPHDCERRLLEGTPKGTRLAYVTPTGQVIFTGSPPEPKPGEPEEAGHNEMGCGSIAPHVLERRYLAPRGVGEVASELVPSAERVALKKLIRDSTFHPDRLRQGSHETYHAFVPDRSELALGPERVLFRMSQGHAWLADCALLVGAVNALERLLIALDAADSTAAAVSAHWRAAEADGAAMRAALEKACTWASNPLPHNPGVEAEWRESVKQIRDALGTHVGEKLQHRIHQQAASLRKAAEVLIGLLPSARADLRPALRTVAHGCEIAAERTGMDDDAERVVAGYHRSLVMEAKIREGAEVLRTLAGEAWVGRARVAALAETFEEIARSPQPND